MLKTREEKEKRIEELRVMWKQAKTEIDRKIIEIQASLIQRTIHTLI